MAKNLLRLYNTIDQYENEKCTLEIKTVSALLDQPKGKNIKIKYESYFIATYDVITTSEATKILGGNDTNSYFDISQVNKMFIDGVEVTPVLAYTFSTLGEHTVKCTFECGALTTCYRMFDRVYQLTKLDITHLDTSEVTNMTAMFQICGGLTSLDLTPLDTSNVTNMTGMFQACSGLTSLDVSNFDTSNVTNMDYMFNDCRNLTIINATNFNTDKVNSIICAFQYLTNIELINISNINLSKISSADNLNGMFNLVTSLRPNTVLQTLDLSNAVPPPTTFDLYDNFFDLPTGATLKLSSAYKTEWETILSKQSSDNSISNITIEYV